MDDCAYPQPPFEVIEPSAPRSPLVVASPHSGRSYPACFVAQSRLDQQALRKSEDSFVDELFAAAPALGAPLLCALFPRAYVDANREPYELDPEMFEDELPAFVNRSSPRAAAGLGTIARIVADGKSIYGSKLRFAEAEARIEGLHRPYHEALEGLVDDTLEQFGICILIDAHSMPSGAARSIPRRHSDVVLGDRVGRSCDPLIIRTAERILTQRRYTVALNAPYAGGYTTVRHGHPRMGCHCLQIEVSRALYMDERRFTPSAGIERLKADLTAVMEGLIAIAPTLTAQFRQSGSR